MMESAVAILRKGIERWNAHDRDGFLKLYDEKVVFVDEPTGQQLVGRAEFGKGFFDVYFEAYPDMELKDVIVFGEGGLVCMYGLFVGTHTGIFHFPELELPPTEKVIKSPFAFIAEVKDEKVISARIFYDRMVALEQEGIVKVEQLSQLVTA
jgi:predicted ester cyclase